MMCRDYYENDDGTVTIKKKLWDEMLDLKRKVGNIEKKLFLFCANCKIILDQSLYIYNVNIPMIKYCSIECAKEHEVKLTTDS
jgi:hypothetical protein